MIHAHPFTRICLSYAAGILIGYAFPSGWSIAVCLCISLLLSSLQLLNRYKYHHWLNGLALCFALCAMGTFSWITYPNPYSDTLPKEGTYHATLLQDVVEKPKTYQCISLLTDTAGNQYKSILYIAKDSASGCLQEGTQLAVKLHSVRPQTFSYYLKNHIYSSAYISHTHWKLLAMPMHSGLNGYAKQTKHYLLQTLQQHTDSSGYALTSAITLGHKWGLTGTTKQYFSISGASHLLAVSGLHVGIIYMAIRLLLGLLVSAKWTQKLGQVLLIALLWGYAFLCGLPPSIVRAVTMFSVGAVGVLFRQTVHSLNTVFFTAFAMLVYNPNYLFDMGFQLSFCAVIGIILYASHMRTLAKGEQQHSHPMVKWVKEMVGVSVVAQLSTLPLILYYFGTFPTYFLITNLLVVPLGTLLVYACLLLFMLSPFSFSHLLDMPIHLLSQLMQGITVRISSLPFAQIESLHTSLFQSTCLFALLLLGYCFCLKPSPKRLYPVLWLVILWLSVDITKILLTLYAKNQM